VTEENTQVTLDQINQDDDDDKEDAVLDEVIMRSQSPPK
jgi:hypothetical protein